MKTKTTEVPPGLTVEELLDLYKGKAVQTRIQFPSK